MTKPKKSHFAEIIFTDEYYINGVNILDSHNRKELKKIDVNLGFRIANPIMKDCTVYLITGKNMKFRIALGKFNQLDVVSYVYLRDLYRTRYDEISLNSRRKNKELKLRMAIDKVSQLPKDEMSYYSDDFRRIATIFQDSNAYVVKYYNLVIEDEYNFHFYDGITKENFFGWEDDSTISYFENMDSAIREIKLNLGDITIKRDYYGYMINR